MTHLIYKNGVKQNVLKDSTIQLLNKIAAETQNETLTINSTSRTPEEQAEAMYKNLFNKRQIRYGLTQQKVVEVYNSLTKDPSHPERRVAIIKAMLGKIKELGASNVSKHCADTERINVVDLKVDKIKHFEDFKAKVEKYKPWPVLYTQHETDNNCFHIEIDAQPTGFLDLFPDVRG